MRDSMIFYRSFYEALTELEPTDKAALYDAIFSYGMNFQEPELKGLQKTIWKLIKPNIDANIKKYKDGNKGGRPPKDETTEEPQNNHNVTTEEPLINHSSTSSKPNVDVDGNVDVNDNEKVNDKLEQFDLFWDLYNKKTDREKCLRKFKTLSEKERTEIFKKVEEYVKSTPDAQFRKNPHTWLNGKCWNDEILINQTVTNNTQQSNLVKWTDPSQIDLKDDDWVNKLPEPPQDRMSPEYRAFCDKWRTRELKQEQWKRRGYYDQI